MLLITVFYRLIKLFCFNIVLDLFFKFLFLIRRISRKLNIHTINDNVKKKKIVLRLVSK